MTTPQRRVRYSRNTHRGRSPRGEQKAASGIEAPAAGSTYLWYRRVQAFNVAGAQFGVTTASNSSRPVAATTVAAAVCQGNKVAKLSRTVITLKSALSMLL